MRLLSTAWQGGGVVAGGAPVKQLMASLRRSLIMNKVVASALGSVSGATTAAIVPSKGSIKLSSAVADKVAPLLTSVFAATPRLVKSKARGVPINSYSRQGEKSS
jgi:hypothetical protein